MEGSHLGADLSTIESCLPNALEHKNEDRVKLSKEGKNLWDRLYAEFHTHNPSQLFIPLIQTSGSKYIIVHFNTCSDFAIL